MHTIDSPHALSRRRFLALSAKVAASATPGFALAVQRGPHGLQAGPAAASRPTDFQHACTTLPYGNFTIDRALAGIRKAGYRFVAWGPRHKTDDGGQARTVPFDAPPEQARELGQRCRDLGLEPVLMFSDVYPEHERGLEILTHRIRQAAAAGIAQVLTFGHTEGGNRPLWVQRFKKLGPLARDHNVVVVVKQHGGSTGTGEACAEIIREVNDAGIRVNYDAGNVMDYLDLDPIPDLRKCADVVRSLCIKDHRNWPKDEDCGPGFGEIDHYRLLEPIAFTGLTIPLAYENIWAPLSVRPDAPEAIDALARRAREFLETVIAGLQSGSAK